MYQTRAGTRPAYVKQGMRFESSPAIELTLSFYHNTSTWPGRTSYHWTLLSELCLGS